MNTNFFHVFWFVECETFWKNRYGTLRNSRSIWHSETLEVLNKIKAAQHQLQKTAEEAQLEESECKQAEIQYGEKCRKLYLCKLTYKLTNLETCMKTENKAHDTVAEQRKKLSNIHSI